MAKPPVTAADDTVAGRIRLVLAHRGLTVRDLARRSGVPYRTLQDTLTESYGLKVATLAAICRTLGVSADYIVLGVGTPAMASARHLRAMAVVQRAADDLRTALADIDREMRS